ncbi:MAG: hypothetical protein D6731_19795, partial [Planctomycetota bacterium]
GFGERGLAFALDLVFLLAALWLSSPLLPDLSRRASEAPGARDALLVWGAVGVVAYFAIFEVVFARTPGKRLVGLEVQTRSGSRPRRAALLYRNLFRVELLLPAPFLAPLISLLVMASNPFLQRPGDLVAGTVVRRARSP